MLENNTFYFLFFSLFENIIGNRFENIIGNRLENIIGNRFENIIGNRFENIIGNRFENIIGNRFVPTCLNPITGLDKDDRTEPVNFDKCIDQMKFWAEKN